MALQKIERRSAFVDYYCCSAIHARIGTLPGCSDAPGYFRFGEAVGYGRLANERPAAAPTDSLPDASRSVTIGDGRLLLPFDLSEVATNLRQERYPQNGHSLLQKTTSGGLAQNLYYLVRPYLGVSVRKHLQKVRLRDWEKIPFPRWPMDRSVDLLMENAMALVIKAHGGPVPFIWFWPDAAPACITLTHDVEGQAGLDRCDELMDLDDRYGIKSAFQLIPEGREQALHRAAGRIRQRGFEVNLHDLNHDGRLFADKDEFLRRAKRINDYAREFGCEGFRAGVMYRQQEWFDAFEFSYDMSVPSAAHLEPQRGGCCTVMPYFIGEILEIPLTTVQDYTLFHILNDYSTALWQRQIELVSRHHGLVSLITHPDYLVSHREQEVYVGLLQLLSDRRDREGLWVTLPGEINRWWRSRQKMALVRDRENWRIEGPDADRARVAYASLEGNRVVYTVAQEATTRAFA